MDYLEWVMRRLSNIVYNSQWNSVNKEEIVESLANIVKEYEKDYKKDMHIK
jgi:hypothetical protein